MVWILLVKLPLSSARVDMLRKSFSVGENLVLGSGLVWVKGDTEVGVEVPTWSCLD